MITIKLILEIPEDKAEQITKYYSDDRGDTLEILEKLIKHHVMGYLSEPEDTMLRKESAINTMTEKKLIEEAKKAELELSLETAKEARKEFLKVKINKEDKVKNDFFDPTL